MANDSFRAYQEQRAKAEQAVKENLFGWAMLDGQKDMTVGQLRELTDEIVKLMNHHTRQAYDLGLAGSMNRDS